MTSCPVCGASATVILDLPEAHLREEMQAKLRTTPPSHETFGDYKVLQCTACTLEFADPQRPGTEAFYQWLASKDWYYPGARWEWAVVIEQFRRANARTIVEVGCGSGSFLEKLRKETPIRGI